MKIIKLKDYEEVSAKASELVIKQIKKKPKSVLGLATGSTPIRLYEKLIEAYERKEISFKDVISYNLDEYIGIDRTHPQSYYQYMHQHLFSKVDMNEEHIHIPNNDIENVEENAKLYNQALKNTSIDMQILGIGSNGHIGFNEPGTPLGNETFIVELDEQTRKDNMRFFSSLDEVPKYAITMGIKNIMRSKHIILMASGKEKADAVYQMVHGEVTKDLPASVLQLHPNVVIIVDELAGSKL
ncbi:MAG: glucosamine-6-phosphate deaminase [Acholeplasmataceae bacterium]